MNNYFDGSNGLHQDAQFAALEEIHRMIEAEAATPRAQARWGELRAMIFALCALAAASLILTWLGV